MGHESSQVRLTARARKLGPLLTGLEMSSRTWKIEELGHVRVVFGVESLMGWVAGQSGNVIIVGPSMR